MMAQEVQRQPSSLADLVGQGCIAPVWCDGREILRRIFVTVRNKEWREIPPTLWESTVDEATRTIQFNAHHLDEGVDFEWRGTLTVSRNHRELRFALDGKAQRDMELCRLGLVVLHPVESLVESRLSVFGPDGSQQLTIPRLISPQPFIEGVPQAMTEPFSRLVIERADFGRLELRFSGELFELEDQRNWGDASFKTYCSPLRLGFPRCVGKGTVVTHRVDARFVPVPVRSVREHRASRIGVFPVLGCEQSPGSSDHGWHHVRVESDDPSVEVELSPDLGRGPEVRSSLTDLLTSHSDRIRRLLVYGSGTSLPSLDAISRVRQFVEKAGVPEMPLYAATRGYFVEHNRALKFDLPVSGIACPLSPTVHGESAEALAENVAAIVDIGDTARHLTGLPQIAISPLALRYPRALAPSAVVVPASVVLPWMAASLGYAALAGITSVTLAADLVEASTPELISKLLQCVGLEVTRLDAQLPIGIHGFKLGDTALIANLSSQSQHLSIPNAERDIDIAAYGITWMELESRL